MSEPHRGLAIYKEDGSNWTPQEMVKVINYCDPDQTDIHMGSDFTGDLDNKYIWDDDDDSHFMYSWEGTSNKAIEKICTVISYEDLFKTRKPLKTYKVSNYDT